MAIILAWFRSWCGAVCQRMSHYHHPSSPRKTCHHPPHPLTLSTSPSSSASSLSTPSSSSFSASWLWIEYYIFIGSWIMPQMTLVNLDLVPFKVKMSSDLSTIMWYIVWWRRSKAAFKWICFVWLNFCFPHFGKDLTKIFDIHMKIDISQPLHCILSIISMQF